jgi:hypothetical protein
LQRFVRAVSPIAGRPRYARDFMRRKLQFAEMVICGS